MGYRNGAANHLLFLGTFCLIAGLTKAGNNDDIDFQCQSGWTNINYTCYKSINTKVAWDIAKDYCKSLQSELVKIPDYWVNKEIGAEAVKNGLSDYWIGFSLLGVPQSSGNAHWSDGEESDTKHGYWSYFNPDSTNGKCSYETQTNEGPKWSLGNCDTEKAFVCEKQACTVGTFMCGNSRCIAKNQVCDGKDDCQDGTDEQNCQNLCRFYQTGSSGTFSSSNYPQNYLANSFCLWKIQSSLRTSISLTFSDFITEVNTDFVEIFVGSLSESDAFLKYRLSGDSIAPKTYTSPNNMMLVKFTSDSSTQLKGFSAKWTAVSPTKVSSTVNAFPSGNLTVSNFMNNEHNTYIIQSVTRREIITLTKLHMELFDNDEVVVFDGDSLNSPILATYKGPDAGLMGPKFIQSTGEAILVLLKSRGLFSRGGFTFSYLQGCKIEVDDQLSGEIMTPGFNINRNYPNSLNCEWEIDIPNNKKYSLQFDSNYDIDNPDDFLYIYNTDNSKKVLIFNSTAPGPAPTSLDISSGSLNIMFDSNAVINKKGFKADYSVDCPDPVFNPNTETTPSNSKWHYKSTFNVSCKTGYGFYFEEFATETSTNAAFVSQTPIEMICLKDGKWNVNTIPQCTKSYCGPVPAITNGRIVNATGVHVGDVAFYTCTDGYTIKGNDSINCQDSGTWETVPICTATGCTTRSNITNGLLNITEGTGTSVGSIISYTCDSGYQIDGVPISQCAKSGQWSDPAPSCQILKCSDFGLEEKIPNAIFDPAGDVEFGMSKNVSCENGYSLNGTRTITCLADQSFGTLPQCDNIDECASSNSNQCNQICVNTIGSYYCKCEMGYQLEADNVTCKDIDECASNNGDCEQICKNTKGSYECECNEGYALYTSDNTMSYNLPQGESGKSVGNVFYLNHSCVPVLCPNVGKLADGNIQPQRKFNHFGDTLYYSCNIGFNITGDKTATCLKTGNWSSNLPTCTAITCAAPAGKPAVPYKGLYNFTCEVPGKPTEYRQRQCLYDPIKDTYELLGDSYLCEEIDCGKPKPVPGELPVNITNTTYGSQYEVKCSDLYRLKGNTSHGNLIYCNNDGKWEYGDIKCDGVQCDFPPVPVDGAANVTGFKEGSIATYYCLKGGYAPRTITKRTCVKNSAMTGLEWDHQTPTCVDVQPPTIQSGSCNQSITLDKYSKLEVTPPNFVDNSGDFTVETEPKEAINGLILTNNITITYTAIDAAGYNLSCQKIITVEDRPFEVACPSNMIVELENTNKATTIVFHNSTVIVTGTEAPTSISFMPIQMTVNATNIDGIQPVVVEASAGTKRANCTFYVSVKAKSCSALSVPSVQYADYSSVNEFTCQTKYSFPERTKMAVGCSSSWNTTYTSCSKLETFAKLYSNTSITYTTGQNITSKCADVLITQLQNKLSNGTNNPCRNMIGIPQPTPANTFSYIQDGSKIIFNGLINNTVNKNLDTQTENACFEDLHKQMNRSFYDMGSSLKTLKADNCPALTYATNNWNFLIACDNRSRKVSVGGFTYCVPCPPGSSYDLSSGAVTCNLCPIGEYQDKEDQPSCVKCPSTTSTYSTGGYSKDMCKPQCSAGFTSKTGVPPCIPCPVNTYYVNVTHCESCPQDRKGRVQAAATIDVCKAQCKEGTFSFDGYEPCQECPKGFYTDLKKQTGCSECDVNTTTSKMGADNKTLCLSVDQVLCNSNPCKNGGQCVPRNHLYQCVCSSGFTGEQCNAAVDPCLPNPCYYGGNCSKDGTGYKCTCPTGTNGKNCENIIEKCANDTCKNNGVCRNIINDVKCYCTSGYTDKFCDRITLPCVKTPCVNGTCTNIGTENFKCDCNPGFKGDKCDQMIDNCASKPCLFNAACTNLVNDYWCNCSTGYSGKTCSQRADLCSNINCNVGTCVQNIIQRTYTCSCDVGYTYGEYCQMSMKTSNGTTNGFYKQIPAANNSSASCITECLKDKQCKTVAYNDASANCSFFTTETDACCQIFTKECQKPTDNFWTPWYPIKDSVDPAKILKMLNDVGLNVCNGQVTSLTQCKTEETEDDKMRPDKYDMSIGLNNPCKVNNLNCVNGNENECSMYRIRFQCAVSKVMQNNQCENKSACDGIHCENGAKCVPLTSTCGCPTGYEPPYCRVRTNFCAGKSCGNGICVNGATSASCKCHSGFEGPTCTNINDCKSNPCNATGTEDSGCEDRINDYYCPCKAGYKGKNCEENIDECQSNPCLHKGVCKDEVADFTCVCPDGWTGKRCENIENYCTSTSCANNGDCLNIFKNKYCRCQPNTFGSDCSDSVSICKDANPCINEANCTEFGGKSTCKCPTGFAGVGCEIVVDFCKSEVCANGGTCSNTKNGYLCQCKKGFNGLQCEQDTNDCTTSMNTCVEPASSTVCPLGKTGNACSKDVTNNYNMQFYLHEKNGMATLKSAVFVPNSNFAMSLWVRFKEKGGQGTFLNLFMIKSEGINEEKILVLRISDAGITYVPESGEPAVTVKINKTSNVNNGNWHLFTMSLPNSNRLLELRLDNFQTFESITKPIVNFFGQKCIVMLGCYYDPQTDMALVNKGFYGELSQVNIYNKSIDFNTDFDKLKSNPMKSIGDILVGWGDYIPMRGARKIPFSTTDDVTAIQTFVDVKSCPNMVNNYGSQGRTVLTWTTPQFTKDKSELKMMNVNYRMGTNMLWGQYAVTYEAMDQNGNVALCNFRVYAKEKNCTKPDDPYDGTAVCTDVEFPYYSCQITCNQGKALTRPAPRLFTCGPTGWWHPNEYYLPMRLPSCGDIKPTVIHITLHLKYSITSTNCETVKSLMKPKLVTTMVELNKNNGYVLCKVPECTDIVWKFTCNDGRANAAQDFAVAATIFGGNSSVSDILTKAALDDKKFNYPNFVAGGNLESGQYYLTTTESCNGTGVALIQGVCVECTPGTYLNISTQCDLCPVGTYQENVAQPGCDACPTNTTTFGTGHMNISDCKTKCPPGSKFDTAKDKCVKCDIFSYQDLEGQFYCKHCLDGKTTSLEGATNAGNCTVTCPAGYEFTTNCTACEIGYYRKADTANTCEKCSPGKITPSIGSTSDAQCNITACLAGTYLNETTNTCSNCIIGEYQDEPYQTSCKLCPTGNYRTDAARSTKRSDCYFFCDSGFEVDNNACKSCPKGTYKDNGETHKGICKLCVSDMTTPAENSTSKNDCTIRKCPAGQQPNPAQNGCVPCPIGSYQPKEDEAKCIKCGGNSSTPANGSIEQSSCDIFCESGYERVSGQASPCKECEIGSFKDNSLGLFTKCQLCPNGNITEQKASISEQNCTIANCSAGQYLNSTLNDCFPCDYGYYQDKKWMEKCMPCKNNHTTYTKGADKESLCLPSCEAGYGVIDRQCKLCPIGYFNDGSQPKQESCSICPNPEFVTATEGAISATNCTVKNCTAGTYLLPTNNTCLPCPLNTYQNVSFQTDCKPCESGFKTWENGSSACVRTCPAGEEYKNNVCTKCEIGYYRKTDTKMCISCPKNFLTEVEGATDDTFCTVPPCVPGTFYNGSDCIGCPKNFYQDKKYQKSCTKCPGGFYTKAEGSKLVAECLSYCATNVHNCSENSTCADDATTGFKCNCKLNFIKTGSECLHMCDIDYCLNGATCIRAKVSSCLCDKYYTGVKCESKLSAKQLSSDNTNTIIAAVVGVLAALLIIILIITLICVRMRNAKSKLSETDSYPGSLRTKFAPMYLPATPNFNEQVTSFTNDAYNEDDDPAIYKA